MELALNVIFGVLLTLMSAVTTVAAIMAYEDLEGKTVAVCAVIVGFLAIVSVYVLFLAIKADSSMWFIMTMGTVSMILMFALWLMHVVCAVVGESGRFGKIALGADIVCAAGLIAMTALGLFM